MGNDFPYAVFASEASANKYVNEKKKENKEHMKKGEKPKIYWRSYMFEVIE